MSLLTANGHPCVSASIAMPRVGAWLATLDVNVEDAGDFTGAVTIETEDGALGPLVGTVLTLPGGAARAGTTRAGRTLVRVVGGAGGMATVVPPRAYTAIPLRLALADILLAAGETLSTTTTAAVLDFFLARWVGTALTAESAIRALADFAGVDWRILPSGTVWLGTDAYPVVTPGHTVVREMPEEARVVVATLPGETAILPGDTFLDRRVSHVVHSYTDAGLQSDVTFDAAGSRGLDAMRRIIRRENVTPSMRAAMLIGPFACKVIAQNANGTLELKPDLASLPPISKVPVRTPFPGASVENVANGARCMLWFEDADDQKPVVWGWESGEAGTVNIDAINDVAIGEGAAAVTVAAGILGAARMTDTVQAGPYAGTITSGSSKVSVG